MQAFKKEAKQVSVFITAGFPTKECFTEQILTLQKEGVDFIEVGIPFSDPMADGPVIQMSSDIALKNGTTIDFIFEELEKIKDKVNIPLVLMGYLNPVLAYGMERFLKKATGLGIKGLILPDLSYEIANTHFSEVLAKYPVPLIHLITPKSSNERITEIAHNCKNSFVYLVSSNSITGEKNVLQENSKRYKEIQTLVEETPLFIGFGIKTKADIELAQQFSDGAIIGSAYIAHVQTKKNFNFLETIMVVPNDLTF